MFASTAFLMTAMLVQPARPVALRPGMVIRQSTTVQSRSYTLPNGDDLGTSAAITIEGNGITVDFQGATLRGTPETVEPDQRKGTALLIRGRDITIKNVRVRGYKLGLMARYVNGLRILDSDFSYNWEQKLASTLEREDLSDWMSYHRNEKDEWLRYGAAIYLSNCDSAEIKGNRARAGQNGLMMTNCDHGLVWNNDFSFLSGAGLAMYTSSDNRIMHNKMDWCVRGYSHGVYNRGQDSSGVIIYEQSHRNLFAYNSATHGGDGFFLWAGQTTMDHGTGGANDNILYGNDWSHSPANGIEATFSRNVFVNNLLLDNWHGIWGGYSFDTKILGNVFGGNGEGIAIEHGQDNEIRYNLFDGDRIGTYLWQNDRDPDPNWGYPKFKDTRNFGTLIQGNVFRNSTESAIELGSSFDLEIRGNLFEHNGQPFTYRGRQSDVEVRNNFFRVLNDPVKAPDGVAFNDNDTKRDGRQPPIGVMSRGGTSNLELESNLDGYLNRWQVRWNPWPSSPVLHPEVAKWLGPEQAAQAERVIREFAVQPLPGGMDPFLSKDTLRGRRYILVNEWGPYDFRSPILWPRGEVDTRQGKAQRFEILGPKGTWKVTKKQGVKEVSAERGAVPGMLDVWLTAGEATNIDLELEYVGEGVADYRGVWTPAGKPVKFSYRQFFAPVAWTIRQYNYDPATQEPRTMGEAFKRLIAGAPVSERTSDRLEGAWGGSPAQGITADHFATVAEGTFSIDPGDYVINLTTDDGARVWLDGKLIIDEWKYQGPTLYTVPTKLGGKHTLRVEHFEIDGYSALKLDIEPKR